MDLLLPRILIVLAVVGGIWYAMGPRYVFLIRVQGGVPRCEKGKTNAQFLQDVQLVLSAAGVSDAWVGGTQRGKRIILAFSRSIPDPCRQQLRNIWTAQ